MWLTCNVALGPHAGALINELTDTYIVNTNKVDEEMQRMPLTNDCSTGARYDQQGVLHGNFCLLVALLSAATEIALDLCKQLWCHGQPKHAGGMICVARQSCNTSASTRALHTAQRRPVMPYFALLSFLSDSEHQEHCDDRGGYAQSCASRCCKRGRLLARAGRRRLLL